MSVESSTLESEIAASAGSPVKKVVKPETVAKEPASNGDGKENGKTESPTKKDEGYIIYDFIRNLHLFTSEKIKFFFHPIIYFKNSI